MKLVSVIIPVKNGESTLGQCLESIYSQSIADKIEVIVLDSGSTDSSLLICTKYPVRVVSISPSNFNHGITRNYGATLATGEFIYFTVQDANPAETDMLERMLTHFTDEKVQAMVGMQAVPNDKDKNPAIWFKRYSIPQVETKHFPCDSFTKLQPAEQFGLSAWDNVNAMYRKSALMETPFRATNFSEDWLWANDALHKGYKLIRDPSCVTYHYHHMSFQYAFRVDYIINYHFFQYFERLPRIPNSAMMIARALYRILNNKELSFGDKLYWSVHNLSSTAAHTLSHLIFLAAYVVYKERGLEITYKFFCQQVPQGKPKD